MFAQFVSVALVLFGGGALVLWIFSKGQKQERKLARIIIRGAAGIVFVICLALLWRLFS